MGIIVPKQFGFTNGSGNIANLVDGNLSSFYQPLATDFGSYTAQFFLSDKVTLNVGASFPALEFDLGEPKRIPQFLFKVESPLTLGPTVLIGSNVGATSPANTLQSGDILLDQYSGLQLCSNKFLEIAVMKNADVRRRFLRFLQRTTSNDPAVVAPTPGPSNSVTFDSGEGDFLVPSYGTKLRIEVWGGGAMGGATGTGINGATSSAERAGKFSLTANGGAKSASGLLGGAGGTASGGNVANVTGGAGEAPNPTNGDVGYSGKGGDAPSGGLGGERIYQIYEPGRNYYYGNDGQAPGGGGGGHSMWYPAGDVYFSKYPGGGAGGYSCHEVTLGSGDAEPGSLVAYAVGDGGHTDWGKTDGRGAQGRVRFSWT